jgi:hypothetical protein
LFNAAARENLHFSFLSTLGLFIQGNETVHNTVVGSQPLYPTKYGAPVSILKDNTFLQSSATMLIAIE